MDRESIKEMNHNQFCRHIEQSEPPRPSQRLSTQKEELETIAERRGLDAKQIRRQVGGELDWVIMRAIEKDRHRRYQSPRDLSEDVQRYLRGDAVEACPPSFVYRARKFAKKNRPFLVTAACVLVTAIIGSLVSLQYARRANRLASQATVAQSEAEKLAGDYKSLLVKSEMVAEEASEQRGLAESERDKTSAERSRAEQALYVSDIRLAA